MTDNPNNIFITNHAFDTRYSSNHLYMGKIVNKQRHNDLSMSYDVDLFDWGVTLRQCKRSVNHSSYNGNGQYSPLDEGDPVLILCKNGMMEDAVIIRSFYTTGDYQKYLDKGEGNKPGETVKGNVTEVEANQPSIHPNRVTQPDAQFDFIGAKILASPFDSPEFHSSIQDKAKARPQTGSIIMRNGAEIASYTFGSIINYCDGNNIMVSGGSNEEKCTQLLRLSNTHSRIAQLLGAAAGLTVGAGLNATLGPKDFTPSSDVPLSISDKNESLPASYRVEQNSQLAKQALERAQECSKEQAATMQQAANLQSTHGNETGDPKAPFNVAGALYKPNNEKNTAVYAGNKASRYSDKKLDLSSVSNKIYTSSKSGDKAQIQSVLVKELNGSIVYEKNSNTAPSSPASTIKLMIANLIIDKIEKGELSLSKQLPATPPEISQPGEVGKKYTVGSALNNMLVKSGNTSTNALIRELGGLTEVTKEIQSRGYSNTVINNYLSVPNQYGNPSSNRSTANDVTKAMQELWGKNGASAELSRNYLKNASSDNQFNYPGRIANKIGSNTSVIGDSSIIEVNNKRYIITLFFNKSGDNYVNDSLVDQAVTDIYQLLGGK